MVSIKDVAKLAGVSASTVSLVLNGSDKVKHETAYKVRQAVEELHYVP
ncbi:MAG: LacI family DNA-binding transcriptional regulator, partial [Clostridia bacterium]|nr:LacI family DNA-binding transcriptional regulator [Clostridia bacterium]